MPDAGTVHDGNSWPALAGIENLHSHHIATLAYLLAKGARLRHVEITTTELGNGIKKSQQSASRHLADLEREGIVERGPSKSGNRISVRITDKGMREIELLFYTLSHGMGFADRMGLGDVKLEGTVVSGMGEGAYYMALDGYTAQFHSKIGYVPFPGTLNIRLRRGKDREEVRFLQSARMGRVIESFSDGKRTYGWVRCLPAVLVAKGGSSGSSSTVASASASRSQKDENSAHVYDYKDGVRCELIFLERTHHDDMTIELISQVCLRDAASIHDGSDVTVIVLPGNTA